MTDYLALAIVAILSISGGLFVLCAARQRQQQRHPYKHTQPEAEI